MGGRVRHGGHQGEGQPERGGRVSHGGAYPEGQGQEPEGLGPKVMCLVYLLVMPRFESVGSLLVLIYVSMSRYMCGEGFTDTVM